MALILYPEPMIEPRRNAPSRRAVLRSALYAPLCCTLRTLLAQDESSTGSAAIAGSRKSYADGRPVMDVAAQMTDLSIDELKRLLDPKALTEGGIKGAGSSGQ